jgi:hypothetical protein
VIVYKKCLGWSRELKKLKGTKEYGLLQCQCNKKAVELGFLKEWGEEAGRFSGSAKETETQDVVEQAPVFELDDYETIPIVEI